ncbi:MAG: hypothetical protein AABY22_29575, partial [Nanoarchaeota archaeon]
DLNQYLKQKHKVLSNWQNQRERALWTSIISAVVGAAAGAAGGGGATAGLRAGEVPNQYGSPSFYGTGGTRGGLLTSQGFKKYAMGGKVFGGQSSTDNIPAMLTGGEFVVKKNTVDKYGSKFFDRINKSSFRGYAEGGLVGQSITSSSTEDLSSYVLKLIDITNSLKESLNRNFNNNINTSSLPNINRGKGNENQNVTQTAQNPVTVNSSIVINIDQNGQVNSTVNEGRGNQNPQESLNKNREFAKLMELKAREVIISESRPGGILFNNDRN